MELKNKRWARSKEVYFRVTLKPLNKKNIVFWITLVYV